MFKKLLLTLSLVAMVGVITAQSLRFELEGTACEEGQVLISPFDADFGEYLLHLQLRNLTDHDMNVVVEKEVVQAADGAVAYFCWGMCFGEEVMVSRPPVPVPAQTLSDQELSFHVILDELSEEIEVVNYYAYDESDPTNRISVQVMAGQGANVTENMLSMGHVYPNPATSRIHVDFKCENAGASVVIYNLLGQEVKSQTVNGTSGRVDISVEDLQPGIYFCSLRADNAVAKTEKFIVKR